MVSADDRPVSDQPYPGRREPIVRHLHEVTAEWLTDLLANRYPGIVVRSLDTVEVKNSHTTKMRVRVDLNDVGRQASIPAELCLKANWSDGVETADITQTEARFFHMAGNDLDFALPHSYYADWDPGRNGRGIVVMEDLGTSAGSFGASTDHLGIDGVAAGLESLAKIHASTWGLADDRSSWPQRSMGCRRDADMLVLLYGYLELNMARPEFAALLPDWLYEQPILLSNAYDELAARELEREGPLCLVHGDAHQGNSFLRDTGERVWCDWQLVRRGHPWRDVNYFMVASLTVDERRAAARELVERYRTTLLDHGATGVADEDAAWEQVRHWTVYGMQAWGCNVDGWGQTTLPILERFFTASSDWGVIEELTAGEPRRQIVLGEDAFPVPPSLR